LQIGYCIVWCPLWCSLPSLVQPPTLMKVGWHRPRDGDPEVRICAMICPGLSCNKSCNSGGDTLDTSDAYTEELCPRPTVEIMISSVGSQCLRQRLEMSDTTRVPRRQVSATQNSMWYHACEMVGNNFQGAPCRYPDSGL